MSTPSAPSCQHVSAYYYICVRILLHMCPRTLIYVSAYSNFHASCAKVYLEHFLCGWDTLEADMRQVAVNIEHNLHPQFLDNEPCVQPFRAFAYPLPPALFVNLTIKVVEQERKRIALVRKRKADNFFKVSPSRHAELLPPLAGGGSPRIRVAYMSSDFGGMVCVCVCVCVCV